MGQRLCPKTFFVFGGAYESANLFTCDAAAAMRVYAHIAQLTRGLPDGARVRLEVVDRCPGGLEPKYIDEAEAKLGATLPASYRRHIAASNGGSLALLGDVCEVLPVWDTSTTKLASRTSNDLVRETLRLRVLARFSEREVHGGRRAFVQQLQVLAMRIDSRSGADILQGHHFRCVRRSL